MKRFVGLSCAIAFAALLNVGCGGSGGGIPTGIGAILQGATVRTFIGSAQVGTGSGSGNSLQIVPNELLALGSGTSNPADHFDVIVKGGSFDGSDLTFNEKIPPTGTTLPSSSFPGVRQIYFKATGSAQVARAKIAARQGVTGTVYVFDDNGNPTDASTGKQLDKATFTGGSDAVANAFSYDFPTKIMRTGVFDAIVQYYRPVETTPFWKVLVPQGVDTSNANQGLYALKTSNAISGDPSLTYVNYTNLSVNLTNVPASAKRIILRAQEADVVGGTGAVQEKGLVYEKIFDVSSTDTAALLPGFTVSTPGSTANSLPAGTYAQPSFNLVIPVANRLRPMRLVAKAQIGDSSNPIDISYSVGNFNAIAVNQANADGGTQAFKSLINSLAVNDLQMISSTATYGTPQAFVVTANVTKFDDAAAVPGTANSITQIPNNTCVFGINGLQSFDSGTSYATGATVQLSSANSGNILFANVAPGSAQSETVATTDTAHWGIWTLRPQGSSNYSALTNSGSYVVTDPALAKNSTGQGYPLLLGSGSVPTTVSFLGAASQADNSFTSLATANPNIKVSAGGAISTDFVSSSIPKDIALFDASVTNDSNRAAKITATSELAGSTSNTVTTPARLSPDTNISRNGFSLPTTVVVPAEKGATYTVVGSIFSPFDNVHPLSSVSRTGVGAQADLQLVSKVQANDKVYFALANTVADVSSGITLARGQSQAFDPYVTAAGQPIQVPYGFVEVTASFVDKNGVSDPNLGSFANGVLKINSVLGSENEFVNFTIKYFYDGTNSISNTLKVTVTPNIGPAISFVQVNGTAQLPDGSSQALVAKRGDAVVMRPFESIGGATATAIPDSNIKIQAASVNNSSATVNGAAVVTVATSDSGNTQHLKYSVQDTNLGAPSAATVNVDVAPDQLPLSRIAGVTTSSIDLFGGSVGTLIANRGDKVTIVAFGTQDTSEVPNTSLTIAKNGSNGSSISGNIITIGAAGSNNFGAQQFDVTIQQGPGLGPITKTVTIQVAPNTVSFDTIVGNGTTLFGTGTTTLKVARGTVVTLSASGAQQSSPGGGSNPATPIPAGAIAITKPGGDTSTVSGNQITLQAGHSQSDISLTYQVTVTQGGVTSPPQSVTIIIAADQGSAGITIG